MLYYLVYTLDGREMVDANYLGYSESEYMAKEYYKLLADAIDTDAFPIKTVVANCKSLEELTRYINEDYSRRYIDISKEDKLRIFETNDGSERVISTNRIVYNFEMGYHEEPDCLAFNQDIEEESTMYREVYWLLERSFIRDTILENKLLALIALVYKRYRSRDLVYGECFDYIKHGAITGWLLEIK